MLTVLVNLDAATERRARMSPKLAAAGLSPVRVGVDFRHGSKAEVRRWMARHFPQLSFDLEAVCPAEAGCWASHLLAWHRLLECTSEDACTVLEDDVDFQPGLARALDVLARQDAFDVVYLGTSSKNISTRRRTMVEGLALHRPLGVIFNTWGYVITRAYAERFFATEAFRIDMPIDHFLGGRARRAKPSTAVVRPALVTEDPAVGPHSQIQPYATRMDRHPMWEGARRAILGSRLSDLYYVVYRWL